MLLTVLNVLFHVFHFEPSEIAVRARTIDTDAALAIFPELAAQGTTGIAFFHDDLLLYWLETFNQTYHPIYNWGA